MEILEPESLDYTSVFDDIFARYLTRCELVQVKTTNMGSLFKLEYRIVFREEGEEKNMIDQLRCRNGNLEILSVNSVSMVDSVSSRSKSMSESLSIAFSTVRQMLPSTFAKRTKFSSRLPKTAATRSAVETSTLRLTTTR